MRFLTMVPSCATSTGLVLPGTRDGSDLVRGDSAGWPRPGPARRWRRWVASAGLSGPVPNAVIAHGNALVFGEPL